MTACVNKKHTRRVALAISASLVGALSLGVAAPVFANEIATQSVTATDALEGGELTGAVDIDNKSIDIPATGVIAFTADGKPQGVVPTEITMAKGAASERVELNDFDYTLTYYMSNNNFTNTGTKTYAGTAKAGSAPYAVGKYIVEMTLTSGEYAGATVSVPFEIKAASLEDVSIVDTVDGSFEFDGNDQLDDMAFKAGDKLLDMDQFNIVGITYKKGDKFPSQTTTDAIYPGDYSMVIRGKDGTIYAGSETEVQFTVTPLDLEKATIVVSDTVVSSMGNSYKPTIVSINGDLLTGNPVLTAAVDSVFKSGPEGSNLVWKRGEYTYTVMAASEDDGFVENTQDVTFVATDSNLAYFQYQGGAFPGSLSINLSNGESFTGDKIQVFKADGTQLKSGEYTVTATNVKTGETTTDLSKVNTAGVWVVTAKVNAAAMDYTLGGSASITVNVIAGEVNTDANVYFVYGGKIVSGSKTVEYDGTDKLDGLQVVVTDSYGNLLTEDEDYQVIVTDKAGNKLDEVVDAGAYTVTVSSDSYVINENDVTGAKLTLTVAPVSVQAVRIADGAFFDAGKEHFLVYTGSAIEPAIEYQGSDGEWHALPADLYTLTFAYSEDYTETAADYKKVDEMKEAGYYLVYLHAVRDNDTNWDLSTNAGAKGFWAVGNSYQSDGIVCVSDTKVFADVPNTHWGAQGIYKAWELGYMKGYDGTKFFGPSDHLTRAQAAVVLYNMGTGRHFPETSDFHISWVEEGLAFPDAEQWYAAELGWATQVGVVEGYPDGNYGGADEITREQFAIMLRNYAAAKGEDVTVDDVDAALEGIQDADTISDWAREAVAWAVENGVMGAEGYVYADQPIERAQAALMTTRFQPKALSEDDLLVK